MYSHAYAKTSHRTLNLWALLTSGRCSEVDGKGIRCWQVVVSSGLTISVFLKCGKILNAVKMQNRNPFPWHMVFELVKNCVW
jgi:hypothetical protein